VGKSIQLDLRVDYFDRPVAGRAPFEQNIIDFKEKNKGGEYDLIAHDDEIKMNTQSSSQWDGLRHFGLQGSGLYFNGTTHRDIDEKKDGRLGIHRRFRNTKIYVDFQTNTETL